MKEILKIENLCFSYYDKPVLKNITISFHEGEKVAVIGRNGSGKSTLFLCMNRVLKNSEGDIYLFGEKVGNKKKDTIKLRSNVGIVFQNPDDQIISGNVFEEISFGILNMGFSEDEAGYKVNETMKLLGIEHLKERSSQYLSGGEKKMVSIADILVMQPHLILFDEPFSSLDMPNRRILKEVLEQLSERKMSITISTHDVDFAYEWAQRIVVLDNGHIVYDGDKKKLFNDDAFLDKYCIEKPIALKKIYDIYK